MNITTQPRISERIYLRAIDPAFAELEGDIPQEKWTWVTIRRVNERDHAARAELIRPRTMQWATAFAETVSDNPIQRRGYEVFWTLTGVGNLDYDDGQAVFESLPTNTIPYAAFETIWGNLDPVIAGAIYRAVLIVNPVWAQ